MDNRRIAVLVLGALGAGILIIMGYMTYEAETLAEAAGWFATGCLALREVISKIENIALGLRGSASPDEPA